MRRLLPYIIDWGALPDGSEGGGGDSLPVNKPDPAPLAACFKGLGQSGGLYVGDSEVDAETAHAAGIPFALFTEGYRKTPVAALPHAYSFSDFSKLPDIVQAVLAPAGQT